MNVGYAVVSMGSGALRKTAILCVAAMGLVAGQLVSAENKKPNIDFEKALGVLELRIQMAENSLKFVNNVANITELISSLEEYLNNKCFGELHKTLDYKGPPTDPACVGYMERLFQINPGNPAALCLRDGMTAQSCIAAYQNQKTMPYYPGGFDGEAPSPTLKAGIPAAELEKLDKLTLTLKEVNSKYQSTEDVEEKSRLMDDALALYEQMLGLACRISALRFPTRSKSADTVEDPEIRQARERLARIPLKIRGEHQEKMLSEVETRFAAAKNNKTEQKRLLALMEAIKNPSSDGIMSVETSERVRLILPKCKELAAQCLAAFPKSPTPICYQDGWFTPHCIQTIQLYRRDLRQKQVEAQATQAAASGTKTSSPSLQPPAYSKF